MAFILAVVVCFLFVLSGTGLVLDVFKGILPSILLDTIASFSFLTHFEAISKGVIALKDVGYFVIVTAAWLYAGLVIIESKKAQ